MRSLGDWFLLDWAGSFVPPHGWLGDCAVHNLRTIGFDRLDGLLFNDKRENFLFTLFVAWGISLCSIYCSALIYKRILQDSNPRPTVPNTVTLSI